MDVKPDMELEEFLQCVGNKLGLSEVTELEHYDEDFEKWLSVSETEDLELKNGAKYRVLTTTQEEPDVTVSNQGTAVIHGEVINVM